jgi:NAD-reducing hydrogenase large subunit
MAHTITINHVTRIEGHARIDIHLNDQGKVASTQFHVTQFRGFEKFVEGRPYYEMPAITARICGICPVSHLLASVKACDAIMAVQIPETAVLLRELLHCAQFVQSHALSFFHLSAPDLLLGFDSDPKLRNVVGLIEKYPEIARDGIALRKFGQQAIERLAGERIHPSWTVPGGVNKPLAAEDRDRILAELPLARSIIRRTLKAFKLMLDGFPEEAAAFGNMPTLHAGLTSPDGDFRIYDGLVRFRDAEGTPVATIERPLDYSKYIGEASMTDSYLKAPYFKRLGYPEGAYRVGPLARLNVAERFGTAEADMELEEYRKRLGRMVHSSFYYHYARLIEALYASERMEELLNDPAILETHVRAEAGVNARQGVGIVEAPRGVLIHHYKVDKSGRMEWANLIVATGHNNLALNRSIQQVAERFVDGNELKEGAVNRVSAVVRAYDPCLSCSTHAFGQMPMRLRLLDARGAVVDEHIAG